MSGHIVVRGARQHNLKNIDVLIPRHEFVVLTGISGSGKSSLAFDTIYAEGQRRYVESLSAYARQFLGQMEKPDVDYIEGLSPAISIDQKSGSRNPRSTVGTVTEIYDYLRLLFARIGQAHCPECDQPIARQTVQQIVDQVLNWPEGGRVQILSPLVRGRKGEHGRVFEQLRQSGFVRVRVNGEIRALEEEIQLEKNKRHHIEAVVDRLILREGLASRLAESLETAIGFSGGTVVVELIGEREVMFSQNFACPDCGVSIEELAPRSFSFNSPFGACPACTGLGITQELDPDLLIPDMSRSLREGAIVPWSSGSTGFYQQLLESLCEVLDVSMDESVDKLDPNVLKTILYGDKGIKLKFTYVNSYGRTRPYRARYQGVIPMLERRHRESTSDAVRNEVEEYMSIHPCAACGGARLKPEVLAVKIRDLSIADVSSMTVARAQGFFDELSADLTPREEAIARQVLKEIRERLGFLNNVGLNYLTLGRTAGTLAGGEAQRIRLATQIGSGLVGVLYILDEPSIGLHQRDNRRLLETLRRLCDLGNTLLVVEHDEETMWAADHIIDIGPGAGEHGGRVVAQGAMADILAEPESITGQYLSGKKRIIIPARREADDEKHLLVEGARENNLKSIRVQIPLGVFTCVTGVSGSGKSTLVNDILYRSLAQKLQRSRKRPGEHDNIQGVKWLDKVVEIDQSPIGRTPRSNPATYTGVFTYIREAFAMTPEARMRGYRPGRFSFNVRGGRCEACRGDGIIKIEMHFLPDVYVPCEICRGERYNRETLEVKYRDKSIAQVLSMTVSEALEFFSAIPRIRRKLQTLYDVGLGYMRLGQPATTLSGGEAQRVKLATELSRRSNGKTMYILDEPTTGLHIADIHRLMQVLQRLVDNGDTVLVIEHNLEVIKCADWLIDLGPEGGDEGGEVVAVGTPEAVAQHETSYTGQFLRRLFNGQYDHRVSGGEDLAG